MRRWSVNDKDRGFESGVGDWREDGWAPEGRNCVRMEKKAWEGNGFQNVSGGSKGREGWDTCRGSSGGMSSSAIDLFRARMIDLGLPFRESFHGRNGGSRGTVPSV